MINLLTLIDRTVPILPLCIIHTCLGFPPAYTEIIFGILDLFLRTAHGAMFVLVNFAPQAIKISHSEEVIYERVKKTRTFWEIFLLRYKTITLGLEYTFRALAAIVLIYGALRRSFFYLRVWVKLTMLLFLFLLTDIGFIIASSVILQDGLLPFMTILGLTVMVPTYLIMAALVNTHWRRLHMYATHSYSAARDWPEFDADIYMDRNISGRVTFAKDPINTRSFLIVKSGPANTKNLRTDSVQGVLKKPADGIALEPTTNTSLPTAGLQLHHGTEREATVNTSKSKSVDAQVPNLQEIQRRSSASEQDSYIGQIDAGIDIQSLEETVSSGISGETLSPMSVASKKHPPYEAGTKPVDTVKSDSPQSGNTQESLSLGRNTQRSDRTDSSDSSTSYSYSTKSHSTSPKQGPSK